MNIAQLLHVERLSAGAFRERAGAALEAIYQAARADSVGYGRAEFFECVRLALPAALDISLAEVIARGWQTNGHPAEGMLVHSTHHSVIDVRKGERLLAPVDVRAEVTIALAPLALDPAGNAIATDGEAYAGAALFCAGEPVLREGVRPVAVPRRIAL